ncbi:hypothetical protein BS50DRAFT_632648 [Corynespora cassiicola Philippines]|uniref:Uncharacterized protein n=1 Tax=Corynespora cassiicola Philippines TaxID=1448308 RepID=A0A2T2NTK7_CORCC|nr:hypothetical protein BS50DRAFT_632648 [Corynespora cassiicola Philippines]
MSPTPKDTNESMSSGPCQSSPTTSTPRFRIKLTLFYIEKARTNVCETAILPMMTEDISLANNLALDLAKCSRADGEVVFLVHQRDIGPGNGMKEYIVGRWDREGPRARNNHDLIDEPQGYMTRDVDGRISAKVQVVLEREPILVSKNDT